MEVSSPPPKAQRAKHQHSRSAANASPSRANNDLPAGQGSRRQRNHNNSPRPQTQRTPAWEGANVSDSAEGSFDANGNFVSGSQHNSGVEDSPGLPRPKKNRTKKTIEGEANGARHASGQRHPSNQHAPPAAQAATLAASATPAKQAYAGPTFHASPAASALPIPKFLSISGPAAAASTETSMQARLDQEVSSSDQSGESSPALVDSKPSPAAGPPREESPLDFFFKADREEKAKKASVNAPATPNGKAELSGFRSAPPQANSWSTIYGSHERHHSRNASSGSGRDMFALELDGTSAQQQLARPEQPREMVASVPATRQARSDPLRSFLNSTVHNSSPPPKSYASPERVVSGYSSDQQTGSPVYYRNPAQLRSSSGPSTPAPPAAQGQAEGSYHYGNRNLSPLFHAAKSDSSKRPLGSGLRRELSASPTANGMLEPPASHASNYMAVQSAQGQLQHHAAATASVSNSPGPLPPAFPRSKSNGATPPPSNTSTSVQTMEDDLRRILKLTALGSSGASGVQN